MTRKWHESVIVVRQKQCHTKMCISPIQQWHNSNRKNVTLTVHRAVWRCKVIITIRKNDILERVSNYFNGGRAISALCQSFVSNHDATSQSTHTWTWPVPDFIINEEADQIFIMPVNERWIYHRFNNNTLDSIKNSYSNSAVGTHTGPNQFALWRKVDGSRRYPAANILHLPPNRCYLPFGLILMRRCRLFDWSNFSKCVWKKLPNFTNFSVFFYFLWQLDGFQNPAPELLLDFLQLRVFPKNH